MMKKSVLALILTLIAIFSLFSCSENDEKGFGGNTITLNVYNWGEYISDGFEGALDSNAAFEEYYYKKFGVRVEVNYTTYATNEDMYSKIKNGGGSYDIVVPSDYMIEKMINEGMLLEFDPNELSNFANIDSSFKGANAVYDPGNRHSVPYTYGMLGIIYNKALVDEEDYAEGSWSLLWNEKYKGKLLQFNNPRDAFGTAMYYLGLDINSTDPDVWNTALAKLSEQKGLVQGYVNDEIFNKMTTASAAVAPYFAGDFLTMGSQNEDLCFYYPREGTNFFVDAMCIPKTSTKVDIAKEYINFMLSEEVAVANALYIGYASPNKLVVNSEAYQNGMSELHDDWYDILYGVTPTEANASYDYSPVYKSFSPEIQAHVNTLWESLKTENSTELWVHITSIGIILSVVSMATYSIYVKKKRSRHYRTRDKAAAMARNASKKSVS